MNAAELTRSCLSICVTCLSQGRKLFPVNDSKSQASLLLNISEGDKLCWECHFFVLKVFAFRSRAERAQALLASALHQNNVTTLNSLSSIMMTPIYMDINVQSDLSQENLKTENIKQESENTLYECPTGDTCISINVPASGSSQEMGVINASWLPIFNIQKEAKGDEGSYGEVMGDDLANASLKSLLSKRSTLISIPPLANKYEDDITIEMEEVEVLREKEVAKRESGNMFNQCTEDSRNSDNAYCAESSEGMGDVIWIPVLNKQIEAKGDERLSGKAISDDIANASLKSLLSRKSTFGISPLPMNSKKYDPTAEVEVINEVSEQKEAAEVETVEPNAPTDSESIYTETVLSEEEMLKWRERKKDLPYYATKAAALKCTLCIETFRNVRIYLAHSKRHEESYGAFACHICGLRSVSERALSVHTAQHYRLLKCKLCGYEWDNANNLRKHGSVAHGVPVTVWDCDQCERKYASYVQLSRHIVCHRVVACPVCGASVAHTIFPQHLRLHNSVMQTCTVCGKKYKGDQKLAIHMKTHDPKVDEAAYCAECNIQFRTIYLYRWHLRYTLKHARSDFRPHKCGECGKTFLTRTSLNIHHDSLHSADCKYSCSVCGQKFKTRTRRNDHVRRVHKRPSRRYICDYCGKTFIAKTTLNCHINTHTGERPYPCTQCDATFGHKSALYLHGRYKHKIKKKTDAT